MQARQEQGHGRNVPHIMQEAPLANRHIHKQVVEDHHQHNAVVNALEQAAGLLGHVESILIPKGQGHLHGTGGVHSKIDGELVVT